MSDFFTILKVNFLNNYKIRQLTQNKRVFLRKIIFILLIGFILIAYLTYFYEQAFKALPNNLFMPLLFMSSMLLTFIMTIYTTKTILFEAKDNDLLLSLPIASFKILTIRLLSIYILGLGITLICSIPGVILAIINNSFSGIFLLTYLLFLIFSPIIPTCLSALFGYILGFIKSKTNFGSIFEIIFNLLIIVLYFYAYYNIPNFLMNISANQEGIITVMKYAFYPIYLLYASYLTNDFTNILLYIAINLAVFVIFVLILKRYYFSIISNLNRHKTKKVKLQKDDFKQQSLKRTLLSKELRRLIKSPTYLLNTCIGLLILLIVAIVSLFYNMDNLLTAIGFENFTNQSFICLILGFSVVLSCTTGVSISLEKNNLWILKSLPVPIKEIINSKISLNILVVLPIILISLLIFLLAGYLDLTSFFILLLFGISLNLFMSNLGMLVNLKFPRTDLDSDVVIVKRSTSSFITVFTGMLIFFFLMPLSFGNNLIILIISILSLLASLVLHLVIVKWGYRRFESIN